MSLALASRRAAISPAWVKSPLWRTARAVPSLDLPFADTKILTDAVTGQSLVTFTRASSGTSVGSDGLIKTAAVNEPRFDHNPTTGESLGLLVEESRTNSIRNNTMVGAVAGTPGTLPTNWIGAGSSGLSREVIGAGTESGIAYVDVRYFGTTTSALFQNVSFEVSNQIAAAQSSIWTSTAFVKLVGGSLANITAARLVIDNYNSSNVALGQYAIGNFVPTTDALVTQRYSVSSTSSTFSNAATAFVRPYIQLEANSGVAIDITLRIGLPQLEQGAFATSVIPTTTAAATRSADVASITGTNFSSWYRQDEGTVFYDGTVSQGLAGFPWFYNISDGTVNNSIGVYQFTNGIYGSVVTSGVAAIPDPSVLFSPVSGSTAKHAFAVKTSDTRAAYNGSLSSAQTSTVMPTVNTLSIGTRVTANRMTGTIRRLTYWPARLSNSTLQSITQ